MASDSKHKKRNNRQIKNVAIIVLHFGEKEETLACLRSLERIRYKHFCVFLIDNGTKNITTKDIKAFSKPIRFIRSAKNRGYAGGNNLGIKQALAEGYTYVLLLNNDTQVSPRILERMLVPQQKKHVGITGCIITYAHDKGRIWFAGGVLNAFFCFSKHHRMNLVYAKRKEESTITDFVTGACMLVKRDVFQAIGLLSEKYFLYWEDVDFCYKAKRKGFEIMVVNEPLVHHSVSSSTGERGNNTLTPLRAYYYARNPFIFIRENGLPIGSGIIGQLFINLPRNLLLINTPSSVVSYIHGLFDGLNFLRSTKMNDA